jgi:hypothetical protein
MDVTYALASGVVIRRQFRPHASAVFPAVWDGGFHRLHTTGANQIGEFGLPVRDGGVLRLAEVHHRRADAPAHGGEVAVYCAAEGRYGAVETRYDPVGGALVDCEI